MKKGYVYKIELENEIYIGSTEQRLCERQSSHNADLKRYPNRKLYKNCIEQGIEKINLIWVADIEFNHTAEKRMIEEEYRKKMNAELNSNRCYITDEERKERDKELGIIYRENNKEELKEKGKIYREKTKDKKKEYYETHKEELLTKMKEYRETHKEEIVEYGKLYRQKNKEKLLEMGKICRENNKDKYNAKRREKIECPICKSIISKCSLSKHNKRKHYKVEI